MPETFDRETLEFIRAYLAEQGLNDQTCQELSQFLETTAEKIRNVVEGEFVKVHGVSSHASLLETSIFHSKKDSGEVYESSLVQSPSRTEIILPEEKDIGEKEEPEGAEHVDFGNETKTKWRLKEYDFILENTSSAKRDRMNVLCLPGKKCLEVIEVYKRLGFRMEYVVGVILDRDQDAVREFLENARNLGIRHHVGDLEKILQKEEKNTVFDLVSLDCFGPFCTKTMRILSQVLINQKALVMLNVMAAREPRFIQSQMALFNEAIKDDFYSSDSVVEVNMKFHKKYPLSENLSHVRDKILALAVQSSIQAQRIDRLFFSKQIQELPCIGDHEDHNIDCFNDVRVALGYLLESLKKFLIQNFKNGILNLSGKPPDLNHFAFSFVYILQWLILHGLYERPYIDHLKRFLYLSHVSNKKTPFCSEFLVLKTPLSRYQTSSYTLKFFLPAIKFMLLKILKKRQNIESGQSGFRLVDRNYIPIKESSPCHRSDIIQYCTIEDGILKIISELNFGRLIQDVYSIDRKYENQEDEFIPPRELIE